MMRLRLRLAIVVFAAVIAAAPVAVPAERAVAEDAKPMPAPRRIAAPAPSSLGRAARERQVRFARHLPLLTLGTAQRLALANVPELRATNFDIDAAEEGIRIAHSAYEPHAYGEVVSAFAGPGTRISAYNGLNDPTVIERGALGVGVSQYITDFGRTTLLVQASEADLRAQAAGGNQTRDVVLLNVTQAYFETLRAAALVTVAVQTVGERQTLLAQASALQRAGLRSMLDVSIADRDLGTAHQQLLVARAQQRTAYSNLSTALGYNELHLFALRDIAGLPPLTTLTPLLEAALRNSPLVAVAREQGTAAQLRAAVAARASYPTLDAFGFFGVTPIRAANQPIGRSYSTGGVALNVPIFTGGALEAQERQARDIAQSANENVVSQENRLLRDVRDAYDTVEAARGNIALSQQVLRTADDAFRFSKARYQIGLSSIVDLSEAQLAEERAAIDRTNATYDYIVQAAELEYVTGMLSGSDLFPGNARSSGPYRSPAAAVGPAAGTPAAPRRGGFFGRFLGRSGAKPAATGAATSPAGGP